jgi:type II secretory pathway component GspD/PulD (secretin)
MLTMRSIWVALLVAALVAAMAVPVAAQNTEGEGNHRIQFTAHPGVDFENLPASLQGLVLWNPRTLEMTWVPPTMTDDQRDALRDLSTSAEWISKISALHLRIREETDREMGPLLLTGDDIMTVLNRFATRDGLNIVVTPGISGQVPYVNARNLTVMDAFDIVLQAMSLDYIEIENPNDPGNPVLMIVQYQEQVDTRVVIEHIEPSPANLVELEFSEIVAQMSQLVGGRIVSNPTSRVILMEGPSDGIELAMEYLAKVREFLPERVYADAATSTPQDNEQGGDAQPAVPQVTKKIYRIANDMTNRLETLKRLSGARPQIIDERAGIILIEESPEVIGLIDEYLAQVGQDEPPTVGITERIDTRVYNLKASATDVQARISPFLTDNGKSVVNTATNSLILQDTYINLLEIEKFIEALDATPQQVLIEATILEATLSDNTDFGLSTFFERGVGSGSATYTMPGVAAGGTVLGGTYNLGFIKGNEWEVAVNALAATTDANILARPKLVIANTKTGSISVGTQVPYVEVQSSSGGASQGVAFQEITLDMELTPYVEPGDVIRMEISLTADNQTGTAQTGVAAGTPIISSREVKTEVFVNDGETVVIGGLYDDRQNDSFTRVPILGDIPVLGFLFTTTELQRTKTDLLFIMTPTIVRDRKEVGTTVDGIKLRVFRPDQPQKPEWFTNEREKAKLSNLDERFTGGDDE